MITVSRAIRHQVHDIQYYDSGGLSDHSLVLLKIKCGERVMGRDLFIIKPFVFSEQEFITKFNNLIQAEHDHLDKRLLNNWRNGKFIGEKDDLQAELEDGGDITRGLLLQNLQLDGEWWENFKNKTRSIAIQVQKNCRSQDAYDYSLLQREYTYSRGTRDRNRARGKINKKLRDIMVKEIFDQKLNELKYNEKCNSTFLRRVSETGRKQFLESIETEDGREFKKREDIMTYLHAKYTKKIYCDTSLKSYYHAEFNSGA